MANIPSNYDNVFDKELFEKEALDKKKIHTEDHNMAVFLSVVSYLTLIGWVVSMIMYDKHKSALASFHLRQSLGLIITGSLLSFIPLIGWALNIAVVLAWFYAIYTAIQGNEIKVPILGELYQNTLDFIE